MKTIMAVKGDMLDAICAKQYPKIDLSTAFDSVLAANPDLAKYALLQLPEGSIVNLPEISTDTPKSTITLWGNA